MACINLYKMNFNKVDDFSNLISEFDSGTKKFKANETNKNLLKILKKVYQTIKWSIKMILLFICVRLRVDWKRQIHKESSVLRTIPSMGKMLIQDFTMLIFGQRISSIKTWNLMCMESEMVGVSILKAWKQSRFRVHLMLNKKVLVTSWQPLTTLSPFISVSFMFRYWCDVNFGFIDVRFSHV